MQTYDGAISDLKGLQDVESCFSSLLAHQESRAGVVCMVDFPSAVDCGKRGS